MFYSDEIRNLVDSWTK